MKGFRVAAVVQRQLTRFAPLVFVGLLAPGLAHGTDSSDAAARSLFASEGFAKARAQLDVDYDRIIADTVRITEVPAPPFGEGPRAQLMADRMRQAGLGEVAIDAEGNVTGIRRGSNPPDGAMVAIGAHLDTVFPAGTDVHVRREGSLLHAPGITDNSASLAIMLGFIRALDAGAIRTHDDILFVANVGEEERGAFRGVRYLLQQGPYRNRIAAFIGLEPGDSGGITTTGVGVHRYDVTFTGPGGHSLFQFGLVNPIAAMAEVITRFQRFQPDKAKGTTVFNVGLVNGGTSINAIPASASLSVDMRSTDSGELARLDAWFHASVADGVATENAARSTANGRITVTMASALPIERPVTHIAEDAPLVQTAKAAVRAGGMAPSTRFGSADSNIPQNLGLPAITLDSGFKYISPHSPQETMVLERPTNLKVMADTLATLVLAANGLR